MVLTRLAPFLFLLLAVLFTACEEKEKKPDPYKQGAELGPCYEDGTCDEGLVCLADICFKQSLTDDIVPDEDDATDTKPDIDKVTDDPVTEEEPEGEDTTEPDDDLLLGPCAAAPCTAVLDSDGECTEDGENYICGCLENFSWNAEDKTCDADTRRVNCANIPDNAHGAGENADGEFAQTWNGDAWIPETFDCAWECDENYSVNEGEDGCVADTRRTDCANIPLNAHGAGENADGKFAQTWDGDGWDPATATCQWECAENYSLNGTGDGCDADTRTVDCTGLPDNAHYSGANSDGRITQTWSGIAWLPAADTCSWECDTNYTANGDICDADTRRTDCVNIPDNAHGIGDNADGKFAQVWDGANWLPGSVVCEWECDNNHTLNGGVCIADTRRSDCTNIPDNAHGTGNNADGKFAQTWDGDSWEPASVICTWECDTNYYFSGGICVADTRRASCLNIPTNAHGIGDNSDNQFVQTWDGDSWEPGSFDCAWECDDNFFLNDAENGCDADTRTVDCTNIPLNAHGTGDNGSGTIFQTWNGSTWLPPADTCTWECNDGYTWNGILCEPDTRRTDCTNDLPDNASWSGDNADGKFQQTWNGVDWEPASFECAWECDENYQKNTGQTACVFGTRRTNCTNPLPTNAHWVDPNTDGKFEQTWDGDSWEPSIISCAWECDENFVEKDGICEPATRRTDCTNTLPDNALWTGDNADGKFQQVWSGASWEPATFECAWSCDGSYVRDGDICILRSIIYVDLNAMGLGSGVSWEQAYTDLSAAVAAAVEGQEIWVAAGTYRPTTCPTMDTCEPRQRHFTLKNGVAIYGGFVGDETTRDERDWEANETILSGDLGDDDIWDGTAWSIREENAVHVFIVDDTTDDPSAILDGFTITAGQADDNENSQTEGGGMKLTPGTAPTIRNCRFADNSAAGSGGAIFIYEADPLIEDTIFTGNHANNGGAIWAGVTNGTLTGCRFEENIADAAGGALFLAQGGMNIIDTRFTNNFSNRGGALYANQSNDTFINCAFHGNTSNEWGGAVLLYIADPSFVNCSFSGNADVAGNDGIVFMQSYATFDNTILRDEILEILEIGKPGSTIYFDPSDPVFSYSNVYQSGGSSAWVLPFGTDGGGNIDADPLFVGSGDDPLMLQATSPCVDTGSNALIPEGILYDILGADRIQNTTVDMGAYEQ